MKHSLKGILITTAGASMWGLCAVAGKFVMGTKGVDLVWMVTLRLILAGTILLGIGYVKTKGEGLFDIWKDKKSLLRLIIVAVFAFAVCQTSYFAAFLYGVTLVGPLLGSVLGLVEPVVAVFASVVILKQDFTFTDIIGICAILGGVIILSVYKERGEK